MNELILFGLELIFKNNMLVNASWGPVRQARLARVTAIY